MPGFVVLTSEGKAGQAQPIAARQWHSGFLPSRFQGVEFHSKGDAVLYVSNPQGIDKSRQRDVVDAVNKLNENRNRDLEDPEVATRIAQYELAFRMQTSVPELMDFSTEPQHLLDAYGTQGGDARDIGHRATVHFEQGDLNFGHCQSFIPTRDREESIDAST